MLRLLILGGTAEARALATRAIENFGSRIEVVTSLAGRTQEPILPPGSVRVGGFGGADGLERYLRQTGITALIDATHPFAARITEHARTAAAAAGIPFLTLTRPAWEPVAGDRWIEVPDAPAAAEAVRPLARRVFLTFGGRELDAFRGLVDTWFLVRRIEPPPTPPPLAQYELILGRGPFSMEAERRLLETHRIEAVVTKASGGEAGRAKLDAARALGLPVVMIWRPLVASADGVTSVDAALAWIEAMLTRQSAG
ncbi:MAG TPA: cobalt-precorrin-6A reductase [Alphaproteobacteria bacterium]